MNKYKNLMSNTLLFAVATFGAKLLPFLLLRFYTTVLPPDEYGLQVWITTVCNLILPIMYLSMGESVIRFGLDEFTRKRDVLTTGILTVLGGYLILLCAMPLLRLIPSISEYLWLIYLYVLASALHTIIIQFVRSAGFVRLFAIDGIFTTVTIVILNIILLVKFKLGAPGYVLSIIISDALSALILFFYLKLYRFIKIRGIDTDTVRSMLSYAIPLVPTAVFWWVTNLSDRLFVTYMCGAVENGIYAVSYQLPNLITLVSMIFTQAWQLSAFTEYKSPEGEKFFSNVFKSYYTFVFLAASGLILFCKPIIAIFSDEAFHEAWRYTPFLVLGVAFSTLVTFLGTVYNAVQKNGMVMLTTFIGGALNIALNWLLIPRMGVQGAAVSTFASFFIVFIIRAVDCQKYIRIKMQPPRIFFALTILIAQAVIEILEIPRWPMWGAITFLLLVVANFGYIWFLLNRLLSLVRRKRKRA